MDDTRRYRIHSRQEEKTGAATDDQAQCVRDLIQMIVNDTMKEKDRTVTIRVDPDGAISVSIYPTIN